MRIERYTPLILACLFPALLCSAEEGAPGSRPAVTCTAIPRCREALNDALTKSRDNSKMDALALMLAVYAEFPDPRLCFNIGRLYHQLGQPERAIPQYQRFLDSGAELDEERLARTRTLLEQAEREAQANKEEAARRKLMPLPGTPESPQTVPGSAQLLPETKPGPASTPTEKQGRSRPAWRIALGSILGAGGIVTAGFGIAALAQNGECSRTSSAPTTPPVCLERLATTGIGAGLLTTGLVLEVGMLAFSIPSRRSTGRVARWGSDQSSILVRD